MRIAIFTNNYLPNPYGLSTSIESFRKEFEKKGHKVYIFAPTFKDYVDENADDCLSERRIFRYPSIDFTMKGVYFPIAIPFSFRMNKILRELEIDIIHSQHPNLLGWEAKRWAKKKKIPLVFTWHTLYDQYAHFFSLIPEKISAWWTIGNAVGFANSANQVIVPTLSVKKIIQKWGVTNPKIVPISTGVDEENFQNSDKNLLKKELGIDSGKIVVLLHSRLTEEKNIFFVFECMLKVLKKNSQIAFIISGNGDLIDSLKEEAKQFGIEKQIFFVQPKRRSELKNIYAAGDIFVYGSKSETQGTVISEAMYMGLPIVAVSASGIEDLVANQVTGLLVKEDINLFVQAVQRLIDDKALREKFSENSRSIARQNYTAQVCSEKMLDIYAKVIASES